jgi:predicted TIM-barrel fold metal-dependent hydrolase
MKSIDVHTHMGLDQAFFLRGWWPYAATSQTTLEHLERNNIDQAVCFPFCLPSAFSSEKYAADGTVQLLPGRVPFDRENEILADEIDRLNARARLLQFGMFDPEREVKAHLENLKKIRARIVGLKTQSTIIKSRIRNLTAEGRCLMEFAEQENLPVLIHTSINPSDLWAQDADCIAVAEAFPKVRFNLAHSMRFHLPSIKRCAQLPNVWVDCSAHLIHCLLATKDSPAVAKKADRLEADYTKPVEVLKTIHGILGEKYLWGSDFPFQSWCDNSLKHIFSYKEEADVLHALPDDIRRSMSVTAPHAWLYGK